MSHHSRTPRKRRRRLFQWLSGPMTKAHPMKEFLLKGQLGRKPTAKAKLASPITIAPVLFTGVLDQG